MADIIVDTFTDINGVGLIRHKSETGAGWFSHWRGRRLSQAEPVINSNRVRFAGAAGSTWNGLYYYEDEISGGNYDVEAHFTVRSDIGIVGRMELTEPHGYALCVTTTQVRLVRFADQNPAVSGTVLASIAHGLTNGTSHKFRLSFNGSTIKAFVNDVEKLSVTDATYSTGGYVGITWEAGATGEALWQDFKVSSLSASLVARHTGTFTEAFTAASDIDLENYGSGIYIKTNSQPSATINASEDRLYFPRTANPPSYLLKKHYADPNQVIEFDFNIFVPAIGGGSLEFYFKSSPDYSVPVESTNSAYPKGYRLILSRSGAQAHLIGWSLFNIQGSDSHNISQGNIAVPNASPRHVKITFDDGHILIEIGTTTVLDIETSSDYRTRLATSGYITLIGNCQGTNSFLWLDNLFIEPEDNTPPTAPCSPVDPLGRPVFDEYDGPNNRSLNVHTSDSGHAWIQGHGIPALGFTPPALAPLVLDGDGALVNAQGMKIEGTHQLLFAPRTKNYEIGFCFTRLVGSFAPSSLYLFWRDTTTEYSRRRGSRGPGSSSQGKRYELYLDSNGTMRLIKRIGNTTTLLDSESAVWTPGASNYVQIINVNSSIEVYVNGVLELNATDAAIAEPGTISLQIYGRALTAPFPKGLWAVHWFYVDDSYAAVGSPNKAVSFTEHFRGRETVLKEELDFDTLAFKNVPDALSVIENIEIQKDEPLTRSLEVPDVCHTSEAINLFKEEMCGGGDPAFFEMGSFTPQSSTGNQVINHSLGVTPKLIIVWCAGKAPGSFGADVFNALGFSDGTTNACIANTIEDAVGTSDTYDRIASNLFLMRGVTGTIVKAATLSAWNTTTFTINHTTANAAAMTVNYLLIAGNSVEAKVGNFNTINTTGGGLPANQSITGIGFEPEGLILLQIGGVGSTFPQSFNSSILIMGFGDAALNQGVVQAQDADAQAVTLNIGAQLTDAVLCDFSVVSEALARKASLASLDVDGFTLTYSNNFNSTDVTIYLALKGLNFKVGAFNKSTGGAPVSQGVTGIGFEPEALLLASWQRTSSGAGARGVRFGIGGSDGTRERALAYQSEHNNTTSQANEITKTDKTFIVCNNDTPGIDAEADLSSFDSDGFTLGWTTNNAVATQILYLAFGSLTTVPCDKKTIQLIEQLVSLHIPEVLGDKGISLLEAARMNELHGVGGSLINKTLQITEFLEGVEILLPNQQFSLTDDFNISEAVTRVAALLETLHTTETQDIRTVLDIVDTANINDVIALYMFHAVADGATINETIKAIMGLPEIFTAGDVVSILNLMHKREGAAFGENVSILKSGPVDIPGDPDAVYQVRLSVYFFI